MSYDILTNMLSQDCALKFNEDVYFDNDRISKILKEIKIKSSKPYLSYELVEAESNQTPLIGKIKYQDKKIVSVVLESINNVSRYRVDLSYDGTNYKGFQKQPHNTTIQDTLEKCLTHLCQETILIHPASRTDAHVHALHQVIHFDTSSSISKETLIKQLNYMLPRDVRAISIENVPQVFHARYDTIKKTYQYILTKETNPLKAHYTHYIHDFNKEKALSILNTVIGTHDFKNFSKSQENINTTRTIQQVKIIEQPSKYIIEITGDGFLRHMVRMLIGHLLYELTHQKNTFKEALNNPLKAHRKYLAPPQALYLKTIAYK